MRGITRLIGYMRPYFFSWAFAAILMGIVGALQAFRVMLIKVIIDNVLSAEISPDQVLNFPIPNTHFHVNLQAWMPHRFHNVFTVVAIALVVSALIKSPADYLGTIFSNRAGFGMVTDLRNDLYNAVLRRSTAFFQRNTSGMLISTLINDVERVQTAMSSVMSDFLQQFATMVFLVAAVIIVGGRMAWVLLIFVPIIIISTRRVGRSVRTTTRKGQDKLAEIQNIVQETVSGNAIVKAFGMERWEMNRFRRAADKLLTANMRSVAVSSISSPLMDGLGVLAIVLLLFYGREYIKHDGTAGIFITFLVAVITLYDPVRKMPTYYNSFQQALGASQEVFRFLDEQDEVVERKKAIALKTFAGSVEFHDVRFGYQRDGEVKEVLHGVSLTVNSGEVVALVGPSGAGKSTLVNLLPRFFDVTGGGIYLDKHDVRDLTLASLRKQIGKVTQETVLFNDTVRNNIAYGQPDIKMERIEEAAKAALAHDFIQRLPQGYNTMIGEHGARLSGGERQRLAIARALLKNAPILILDEATSSLDAQSEAAVQAALANLMQDRTVLVIAHRLSTVRRADRIAVMEAGNITELGTHEELLAKGGMYRRLYDLQFGAETLSAVEVEAVENLEGTA
jgi:subfamily B ATP-binding cassette protein MsbA